MSNQESEVDEWPAPRLELEVPLVSSTVCWRAAVIVSSCLFLAGVIVAMAVVFGK